MRYLELEEVIYIYSEIIKRTGGEPGIADEQLLEAALSKPLVAFDGEELYPDIFTKVAVLTYALVTSKPFTVGNKRTALICALLLLRVNGYQIVATQDSLVDLMLSTEAGKMKVDQLVTWFRRNAVLV